MKNIIFIDTETTGIEDHDRLCQLAAKTKGDFTGFKWLFKPPVPVSVDAMSITHITNEMLEDCIPFKDSRVMNDLVQSINDGDILVAHNAHFDLKMLEKEGIAIPKRHICTMKISHHHDLKAELSKNNLQYLRYYYGLKFDEPINPHDALSDVLVLEKLFDYYLEHYTLEQMIEISSKPILLKKMMFGKYKGEWYKDIIVKDREYMEWMWREMTMDENMRYTVGYYLKGYHRTNNF